MATLPKLAHVLTKMAIWWHHQQEMQNEFGNFRPVAKLTSNAISGIKSLQTAYFHGILQKKSTDTCCRYCLLLCEHVLQVDMGTQTNKCAKKHTQTQVHSHTYFPTKVGNWHQCNSLTKVFIFFILISQTRSRDSSCMDKGSTGPTINDNLKVTDCRMPGEVYSADKQCELQFKHWANRYYAGHKFKFCSRTSYGRDVSPAVDCLSARTSISLGTRNEIVTN